MENLEAGISYSILFISIVLFSLICGAFGEMKKRKKGEYIFVVFSVFFVIMGFRRWYIGNDTLSYIYLFYDVSEYENLSKLLNNTGYEKGYIFFNWVITRFSEDPRILFVITSLIVNWSLGRFVYKYVDNPGLFCCFFVGFMQMDFFLSAMRQGLSIAILLWSFNALIKKKTLRSILWWLLATTFHNAAWSFFIVYFFFGNKQEGEQVGSRVMLYYALFMTVFICSFFFDNVLEALLKLFPKYNYYNNTAYYDGEPRLAIMLKIAVFALLLMVPKSFVRGKTELVRLYNEGEKLSVINLALIIIAHNATALMRLTGTFNPFALMHYSNNISKMRDKERVLLVWVTLICIFLYGLVIVLLKTPDWQTTYPLAIGIEL